MPAPLERELDRVPVDLAGLRRPLELDAHGLEPGLGAGALVVHRHHAQRELGGAPLAVGRERDLVEREADLDRAASSGARPARSGGSKRSCAASADAGVPNSSALSVMERHLGLARGIDEAFARPRT